MKTARIRELLDIMDATISEDSFIAFRFDAFGASCQIRDVDFFRIFAGKPATRRIGASGTSFYSYYPVPNMEFHCCRDENKSVKDEAITLPEIEGGGA